MYVESSYTVSTCANIGGFFTVHNTQGESGRFCYYLQFNCTYYSINNQCYRFKTVTNDMTKCSSNGGYYQHGYCYNHCPTSKYLINETCYDFRSAYTPQKCKENRGYFNEKENYCYYSENCVSGYTINQTCYPFADSGYTAATCTNIGGHFTTSNNRGQSGQFCYYIQFNCSFHEVNGQCYRVKSTVDHETECDSIGGYYEHGYCYYECPDTKYLINDQCYDNRSAQYTQSDCNAVGGVYVQNYCYLKRCNYTTINNKCYRHRSAHYSNGTCYNIGGYYTAEGEYPYTSYCYYTSFNCRYHAANGQCYSRSSNQSQTVCKTIPHSYFDASTKNCYYYCTEMPKLRQCFVAHNSSFTEETCKIIDGIYSNRTCYYITSYCPRHEANNGQCYANRSASLTCDTCHNIRGHYENGFCYYYQNTCSAYSIHGQCYSNRNSTYSFSSCKDVSGLFHDGYCYYEASKCRNLYYRNCTCFQYRATSKTAGTCANIGGYYDFEIQQCFYNTTICPYYNKNSECYRYRNSDYSHRTCSSIIGYYSREKDEPEEYACYFNKIYYNCTDITNLSECIIVDNPSINRETCGIIGGIYANRTCYYTVLQCLVYSTSSSECYYNRSAVLTCNTCQNIGGHFENGFCYYNQYNCSAYSIGGQCYSSRSSAYQASSCNNMGGLYRNGYCYYEARKCRNAHYKNCTCFQHSSSAKTVGTCANIGGYYDFNARQCFYNLTSCPYHSKNSQCYRYWKTHFTRATCLQINGYYSHESDDLGRYRYVCYFNEFNCSNWANNQCYSHFSSSYNEGTCASIRGYYSHNDSGCYYHSFSCSNPMGGQCYDTYYYGWSKKQCDEAKGYYYSWNEICYISNYYCPYVVASHNKCYFYTSQLYDCSSCRLVDGFLFAGTCYYKSNCSESLFLAGNGQCYENQTTIATAGDCSSLSEEGFYDEGHNLCYFSSGPCSSGHYVNCQCYIHRAEIYNDASCENFDGYYTNGRCYYNSSHCPDRYHSTNGQCYRQSSRYSASTCLNIGGYYDFPSTSGASGTCYYNHFNCSGFIVDGSHCYMNRSATYSRATCTNIGGIYGYYYSGRQYRSAGSYISSGRRYYCLYDTFNCPG